MGVARATGRALAQRPQSLAGSGLTSLRASLVSPTLRRPRARLGDQQLGTGFVDVALAHHAAVGECRVELARALAAHLHHRRAATAQVVQAVGAPDDGAEALRGGLADLDVLRAGAAQSDSAISLAFRRDSQRGRARASRRPESAPATCGSPLGVPLHGPCRRCGQPVCRDIPYSSGPLWPVTVELVIWFQQLRPGVSSVEPQPGKWLWS